MTYIWIQKLTCIFMLKYNLQELKYKAQPFVKS